MLLHMDSPPPVYMRCAGRREAWLEPFAQPFYTCAISENAKLTQMSCVEQFTFLN